MSKRFDAELRELKERLVHMGGLAEEMIRASIQDLVQRKQDQEAKIYAHEKEVNDLHVEIDEHVVKLLALQHPVAADLRFLVMVSKIGGELERIADQAVNVCQNNRFLLQYPSLKPLIDMPMMADTVQDMVRSGLDAFVKQDVAMAQKVLDTDDRVDAFKEQIFRELLTYMMSDPSTIQRALALILIARNLERVGDHATNIAEEVIYLVQGRDVRHRHELQKRAGEDKEDEDFGRS